MEHGKKTEKKKWKMRNTHCRNWNMARNTEKRGKCEIYTSGPGTQRETTKNVENEKCSLFTPENREKKCKTRKRTYAHCVTWNMT